MSGPGPTLPWYKPCAYDHVYRNHLRCLWHTRYLTHKVPLLAFERAQYQSLFLLPTVTIAITFIAPLLAPQPSWLRDALPP